MYSLLMETANIKIRAFLFKESALDCIVKLQKFTENNG